MRYLYNVGGTKGKVGNVYPRVYVCVMDVANLYLGTCRYLMYLVSVRSRRLLPRAAAFMCLGVRYVYMYIPKVGRYTCVGTGRYRYRYRYRYLDTGG